MIPSQYHRLKILAIAALATAAGTAGATSFQIDIAPLFKAGGGFQWDHPIAVDLQNDGPDAKGVLHFTGVGFSMDYPVAIAHGASQRVIAYSIANYGEAQVTLDTDQGSATKNLPFDLGAPISGSRILMIGGSYGDLSFIRQNRPTKNGVSPSFTGYQDENAIADLYCDPQDAPPRTVGYNSIQTVVLGPGAERISDGAVAALKTWALEGGTLVFIGKESSPVLADARWQSLLPSRQFQSTTVKTSDILASIGQRGLIDPVTLLEPVDAHGVAVRSDGKTTISTESGFGAGRIVYLAFDPFADSLRHWDGLGFAMNDILRTGISADQESMVGRWAGMASENGQPRYMGDFGLAADKDPFSAKLPPSGQVFEVLAAYFIAVIPLNFLILRKFKRAELAWFTAPVLSLAFASILFRSAGHLYTEKLSTATNGVVLVHPDAPSSVFIGDTTMFIPSGGRYDLAMNGVDSIGDIDLPAPDPFFRNRSDRFGLDPVDTGQVTVPHMLVSNLAYRQISYRQQVPMQNLYSLSMHRSGPIAVCEFRNGSSHPLLNAYLYVGKHIVSAGTIEGGQTKTINVDLTKSIQAANTSGAIGTMDATLGYFGGAALQANLMNFRPGPQIGEQVAARSDVTLLVFSKDALGGIR